MKREKQKQEKLFTWESSQQVKRRMRKFFWVFFLVLQQFKLGRKIKKSKKHVFGFSQSFSNTQEESKKINLTWIIQLKSVNTDNWNEMCEHESNVGGNTYSPKLRLLT